MGGGRAGEFLFAIGIEWGIVSGCKDPSDPSDPLASKLGSAWIEFGLA